MNIQDWFPLRLTGLISLEPKGLSRVFSNTTVQKHQFFSTQFSLWSNSHIRTWLLEKPKALTRWTFVGKVSSLIFNMLSRFVIAFLPRRKRLYIQVTHTYIVYLLETTLQISTPSWGKHVHISNRTQRNHFTNFNTILRQAYTHFKQNSKLIQIILAFLWCTSASPWDSNLKRTSRQNENLLQVHLDFE